MHFGCICEHSKFLIRDLNASNHDRSRHTSKRPLVPSIRIFAHNYPCVGVVRGAPGRSQPGQERHRSAITIPRVARFSYLFVALATLGSFAESSSKHRWPLLLYHLAGLHLHFNVREQSRSARFAFLLRVHASSRTVSAWFKARKNRGWLEKQFSDCNEVDSYVTLLLFLFFYHLAECTVTGRVIM